MNGVSLRFQGKFLGTDDYVCQPGEKKYLCTRQWVVLTDELADRWEQLHTASMTGDPKAQDKLMFFETRHFFEALTQPRRLEELLEAAEAEKYPKSYEVDNKPWFQSVVSAVKAQIKALRHSIKRMRQPL